MKFQDLYDLVYDKCADYKTKNNSNNGEIGYVAFEHLKTLKEFKHISSRTWNNIYKKMEKDTRLLISPRSIDGETLICIKCISTV